MPFITGLTDRVHLPLPPAADGTPNTCEIRNPLTIPVTELLTICAPTLSPADTPYLRDDLTAAEIQTMHLLTDWPGRQHQRNPRAHPAWPAIVTAVTTAIRDATEGRANPSLLAELADATSILAGSMVAGDLTLLMLAEVAEAWHLPLPEAIARYGIGWFHAHWGIINARRSAHA